MHQPAYYQIRIEGELPFQWAAWFDGLVFDTCPAGETLLAGWLPDQAVLRGVLDCIFDLNLPLLSVNLVVPGESAELPPSSECNRTTRRLTKGQPS